MVGVWLLGHFHRAGRVRVQRRGGRPGARLVRPSCRGAADLVAGRAGGGGGRWLLAGHREPVQSAAIAEFRHRDGAARQYRAVLRRPAAVFRAGRAVHQPVLHRRAKPPRPCLWCRPDRRGRGRAVRVGADDRRASVPPRCLSVVAAGGVGAAGGSAATGGAGGDGVGAAGRGGRVARSGSTISRRSTRRFMCPTAGRWRS